MLIDIITYILLGLLSIAYLIGNGIVTVLYDTNDMKREFITNKNMIGKIFYNTVFSLAWALKGIKVLVNKYVA